MHASTVSRFRQAYRDIARQLLITGWNNPEADTLQLVYEHLKNKTNRRWLLVLDNADDADMFFPSSKMPGRPAGMARHIPHNSYGSIIITTRDARVGRKLANGEEPIPVSHMTMQEAKVMMRSRVSESYCESDLERTLHSLGFLPLAITQAAAFVTETQITLSKYLDLLEADDSSVLSKEFDDWRRDFETANSVIQTWKLSFDQIRRQSPRAADILSLMAVLDRQGLHSFLLRNPKEPEAEFLTALGILQSFSLVSTKKGGRVFEMHRLVQLATQSWLYLQGTLNKLQEQALNLMSERFPLPLFENWATCEILSPHAHAVLCCTFELESCILQYAKLLNNLGRYEHAQGLYEAAHKNILKAFEERERILGMEHPDTLTSLSDLAAIFEQQGKYAAAEKMERRALNGREKVLGKEHPDTLTSLNNLALTLHDQAKYPEAEEMCRLAVDSSEKVLGKDHIDTLRTINNLAVLLDSQGKYETAEEINRRALDRREKALGKEHPDTLMSISNLASVLERQGKYEAAEDIFRRTLSSREKVLGKEHPFTLFSISKIAGLLAYQGKYQVAEEMERHVLKIREKILGSEHRDTLESLNSLAIVLQHQGKYEEALEVNRRVIDIRERVLGEEHPITLTSIHNHALVLQYKGEEGIDAAKEMTQRVIASREKVLGKEHPDTLMSIYCLAYLFHMQKKYEDAGHLYQTASTGFKKTIGPSHRATLWCDWFYSSMMQEMKQSERVATRRHHSLFRSRGRRNV